MAAEKTVSSQLTFNGRAVKLRIDTVQTASGRETTREIVEHADCVAIIAVDADDNVLLVKQFRKPVEKELLEIPAGGIDPGESPEDAVRREMQEETGYLPQKLECLGGFYSAPGYCTEYLSLYLASELGRGSGDGHDDRVFTLDLGHVRRGAVIAVIVRDQDQVGQRAVLQLPGIDIHHQPIALDAKTVVTQPMDIRDHFPYLRFSCWSQKPLYPVSSQ